MPENLCVLMIVPKYPPPIVGGLERQAHELAKALLELGVEVLVVSERTNPNQASMHIVDGVTVYSLPYYTRPLTRFLFLPFVLTKVILGLRDKVDIVHIHNITWFAAFVIFLAKLMNLPVLVKLPNVGNFGLPGIANGPFGKLKQKLILSADAIVAMSMESVQELRFAGYPDDRIFRITNGISVMHNDSKCNENESSAATNIIKVLFSGRLSPEKGILDLIAAWALIVKHRRTPIHLELWGDGPQQEDLIDIIHKSGLDDSVFVRGHVADVRRKLRDMDIFVLPSYAEGNSNAILEAMEAGLPIVSTDVGGTAMLVGKLGKECLCKPGDWKALASILLRLINDQKMRLKLGAAMRKRVLEHFSIDKISSSYSEAYALIVAGRRDEMPSISSPLLLEE